MRVGPARTSACERLGDEAPEHIPWASSATCGACAQAATLTAKGSPRVPSQSRSSLYVRQSRQTVLPPSCIERRTSAAGTAGRRGLARAAAAPGAAPGPPSRKAPAWACIHGLGLGPPQVSRARESSPRVTLAQAVAARAFSLCSQPQRARCLRRRLAPAARTATSW